MKNYLFVATLALAMLFSSNSQATLSLYTETDSDGLGDTFKLTFQWDSVGKTITQIMAGSFVDIGGAYQDITQLTAALPTQNGTINALISDSSFNGVVLYLTASAVPHPSKIDTGAYVVTSSLTNPGVFYTNQPTLTAAVPEPMSWVMLLLGLPLINWGVRQKTSSY